MDVEPLNSILGTMMSEALKIASTTNRHRFTNKNGANPSIYEASRLALQEFHNAHNVPVLAKAKLVLKSLMRLIDVKLQELKADYALYEICRTFEKEGAQASFEYDKYNYSVDQEGKSTCFGVRMEKKVLDERGPYFTLTCNFDNNKNIKSIHIFVRDQKQMTAERTVTAADGVLFRHLESYAKTVLAKIDEATREKDEAIRLLIKYISSNTRFEPYEVKIAKANNEVDEKYTFKLSLPPTLPKILSRGGYFTLEIPTPKRTLHHPINGAISRFNLEILGRKITESSPDVAEQLTTLLPALVRLRSAIITTDRTGKK